MRGPRLVVSALAALTLGACSFDGARGSQQGVPADSGADAAPDAAVDAGPRVTCDVSFKQIGLSRYRFVDELLLWNNAISRCRDFENAHLVTFETLAEITAVKDGLPLTMPVWSAIAQLTSSANPRVGWTNRIGAVQTPAPQPFPWRGTEPNDGGGAGNMNETNLENFAELHPEGMFDDGPDTRLSRVLCECTPTL